MATKSKRKSRPKKVLSERQKLIKSIQKSIKYREKQGYVFNPDFVDSISRKQTKTLKEIKKSRSELAGELARHSVYVDPLTNKKMKGTEARIELPKIKRERRKRIKKLVDEENRRLRRREEEDSYNYYDSSYQEPTTVSLDNDYIFNSYIDRDVVGFIDTLINLIEALPDVRYYKGKKVVTYSGIKNNMISYLEDRLADADTEQASEYSKYLQSNFGEIQNAFTASKYSSDQSAVDTSFNKVFEIIKGGPSTFDEAEELERLNEYYEDYNDDGFDWD